MTRLILVDATPYGPEPSGAYRRAVELLARLPGLLKEDVFEVHWASDGASPPADLVAPNLVHAKVSVSCRGGLRRWCARRRALARRHREAPYTHLLTDHGPLVRPGRVCNVVTLHDLRFRHGYGGGVRSIYGRWGYGRALRKAAACVAVSAAVAQEARAAYGLAPACLHTVPNAAAAVFRAGRADGRRGALVVSRNEARKARGAARAAARAAGLALEIVDGGLDDRALCARYQRARWLLAPSLLEGFDLPVVEALACATPVIASDIAPHRDLLTRGAEGLRLVAPPERRGNHWVWPGAVAALGEEPPREVRPPVFGWDDAAGKLADLLRGL